MRLQNGWRLELWHGRQTNQIAHALTLLHEALPLLSRPLHLVQSEGKWSENSDERLVVEYDQIRGSVLAVARAFGDEDLPVNVARVGRWQRSVHAYDFGERNAKAIQLTRQIDRAQEQLI